MTDVFPEFPYSLDDEPTDDWTIEQVLYWWLLHAQAETDAKCDKMVDAYRKELEVGKAEIWACHKQVVAIMNSEGDNKSDPADENSDPQRQQQQQNNNINQANMTKSTNSHNGIIHIEVVHGEYTGKTFTLQPKNRAPCWIGRSQGKKFRDKGISLPKDLEISTTHGKFELIQNSKLCYTDTGSTNGTKFRDQDLQPDCPLELETGMELVLGQTFLRITLE